MPSVSSAPVTVVPDVTVASTGMWSFSSAATVDPLVVVPVSGMVSVTVPAVLLTDRTVPVRAMSPWSVAVTVEAAATVPAMRMPETTLTADVTDPEFMVLPASFLPSFRPAATVAAASMVPETPCDAIAVSPAVTVDAEAMVPWTGFLTFAAAWTVDPDSA